MARTLGVKTMLNKEYRTIELSDEWVQVLGEAEKSFKMLVYGPPKAGKTTFILKLCKELAKHGKVFFDSIEQGDSKSLQSAMILTKMNEVKEGRFMLGDRYYYKDLVEVLRTNRAQFVVIDSLDYINLTTIQYKALIKQFPRKSFIIICWSKGDEPKSQYAKDLCYMVDIRTMVIDGVAHTKSRFGGSEKYAIFGQQLHTPIRQMQLDFTTKTKAI